MIVWKLNAPSPTRTSKMGFSQFCYFFNTQTKLFHYLKAIARHNDADWNVEDVGEELECIMVFRMNTPYKQGFQKGKYVLAFVNQGGGCSTYDYFVTKEGLPLFSFAESIRKRLDKEPVFKCYYKQVYVLEELLNRQPVIM